MSNYQLAHTKYYMEGNMNMGKMHGSTCDCGAQWCGMGYHPVYHLVKKIFVLLVIIFVFWLGLRLGELRTLEHGMHDGMMMGGYGAVNYGAGVGMGGAAQ